MRRVGIVGGGPGGLLTAYLLQDLLGHTVETTIYEASSRLGGKVLTNCFEPVGAFYEAGVAELYEYSHYGPDPLRHLIDKFGLSTIPMRGPSVILDNKIVDDFGDIEARLGGQTATAVAEFYRKCEGLCTPSAYYDDHWQDDNTHPWANRSLREILDEIDDEKARAYIETAIHSDTATEPHLTSALNGLKNVLMEDPRYMSVYSITGGIERLIDRLREKVSSKILLSTAVIQIERDNGGYRIVARRAGLIEQQTFDLVVLALPDYWLSHIQWPNPDLLRAIQKHIAHYDRPAHYLRITGLFRRPFWREAIKGSYFMHDALGGCCIYDESARHPNQSDAGVLSWLLAGNAAMTLSNFTDNRLLEMVLDSLPTPLAAGRRLFLEGRVNRWIGAINGLPGGNPVHDTLQRHLPSPVNDPKLFVVGDYLFDSTLNGVFNSADFVARTILSNISREDYQRETCTNVAAPAVSHTVPDDYFDEYAYGDNYVQSFEEYFCEEWTCDLIEAVWGRRPPYKLLDCGSANGLTLEAFERKNVEAWGIENNRYIHAKTPAKWRSRNLLGDVCKLPFPDQSFDFIYETCLCYLPPDLVEQAIREIFRVCRIGVYCGSISTDMTKELVAEEDLLYGVRTFATMLEWAEHYQRGGFRLAIGAPLVLDQVWQIEVKGNEGYHTWYPDPATMRYCFFSKPEVPMRTVGVPRQRRSAISQPKLPAS